MEDHKGRYSGRYLPHIDGGGLTQFVTFRLADSVAQEILDSLKSELSTLKKDEAEILRIRRIEALLDKGAGSCILRRPECAQIVKDSLYFLQPGWYTLHSWVIMPNHVHFLAHFSEGQSLPKLLHSLKSYTANEIRKVCPGEGSVWQDESFDRYRRSEAHYWRTVQYIQNNPVKGRLCKSPEEFQWSSVFQVRT